MNSLSSLNKYFFRYRGRMAAGILFVAISNLFGIIPARLIRWALDETGELISLYRLTKGFRSNHEFYNIISGNLLVFVLLVLSMALLKGVFMFFMRQTIIVVSRYIEYDMKNDIYRHYQALDYNFYSTGNTGDLMNRISEDVSRVRMYVGPAIMYTVNLAVMFILVIYAMFQVNTELALYTLLPLPLLTAIIYFVHDIINRKSERVQASLSDLSTFVQEAFSGIRVLKSFVRESYNHERFRDQADQYKKVSMDLVKVNALFHPALLILVGCSTILTIFIGGLKVMDGSITIGNIAEFVIYVNMLTWPVASLGWVVTLIQRAAASQQRINEFLHTKPAISSGPLKPGSLNGGIEFRDVSYSYPNSGIRAVSNLVFRIEPGSSLGIIGRTGSGKSTISNLLLRLLDPGSGKILIDGHDLMNLDLGWYRSHVGYVAQDVFLFSDTIENNIAFGLNNELSDHERSGRIRQAASDAAVLKNILEFPEDFRTKVGERGITLSGGQKQRISIARAVVRKPRLLIFDDCLSAVDTRTEEEILSNLNRVMKQTTTIIISHRISSVRNTGHILVLENGAIAEEGSHAVLINRKGLYYQMHVKQSLEKEVYP